MRVVLALLTLLMLLAPARPGHAPSARPAVSPITIQNYTAAWVALAEWTGTIERGTDYTLYPAIGVRPNTSAAILLAGHGNNSAAILALACDGTGSFTAKAYTSAAFGINIAGWNFPNGGECQIEVNNPSKYDLAMAFTLAVIRTGGD